MKNPRITPKDANMINAAIRRAFSRSIHRQQAMDRVAILGHFDPNRPKVKKWSRCNICLELTPTYKMQVDHIVPIIHIGESLEDISWNELVDRVWCHASNLNPICIDCHKRKSLTENADRRILKKKQKEIKNGPSS